MGTKAKKGKTGPKAERLKIKMDWTAAVQKVMQKQPPKKPPTKPSGK